VFARRCLRVSFWRKDNNKQQCRTNIGKTIYPKKKMVIVSGNETAQCATYRPAKIYGEPVERKGACTVTFIAVLRYGRGISRTKSVIEHGQQKREPADENIIIHLPQYYEHDAAAE